MRLGHTHERDGLERLAGDLEDYFHPQSYRHQGDKSDRGAMRRLGQVVRGTYPGATANQCRWLDDRAPWYRRALRRRTGQPDR